MDITSEEKKILCGMLQSAYLDMRFQALHKWIPSYNDFHVDSYKGLDVSGDCKSQCLSRGNYDYIYLRDDGEMLITGCAHSGWERVIGMRYRG